MKIHIKCLTCGWINEVHAIIGVEPSLQAQALLEEMRAIHGHDNYELRHDDLIIEDETEAPALEGADLSTIPMDDAMKWWLKVIGKKPLLTHEEEKELGKIIRESTDDAAVARAKIVLIEANLRLVVALAKRYTAKNFPMDDIIGEGNVGLCKAAAKYDYRKGWRFSTYASWWIRQAMTRAILERSRTMRLPSHVAATIGKIGKVQASLQQELEREPSAREIAERMDIPVDRVTSLIQASLDTVSLDTPVGEEDDSFLGDMIEDPNAPIPGVGMDRLSLQEELRRIVSDLSPREARVIRMRYGLDDGEWHTLEEVATATRVSRERIRQIERLALSKLRRPEILAKLQEFDRR